MTFQFQVLTGNAAGGLWLARRFPLRLGRGAGCDLRIEEPGVYEEHATLTLEDRRLWLRVRPPALAEVNGEPAAEAALRAGDVLTLGSAQLRVWLAPTRQRGLRLGEGLLWALWLGVLLAQFFLLRWLWAG